MTNGKPRKSSRLLPRPILKWAGGKSDLVEQITSYFPDTFRNYYEPFFGGGAVFFGLDSGRYERAFLSDANPELVNLYRCVRDAPAAVCGAIERLNPGSVTRDTYNALRDASPISADDRAARTLYLNKLGFNGLYRVRKRDGGFNTPWGKRTSWIPDFDAIHAAGAALRSAIISSCDFSVCLKAKAGDVVYLDPPYDPASTTASFTGYTGNGFDSCDQVKVAAVFEAVAASGATIIASNSDTPFTRELYGTIRGATLVPVQVKRRINCKGSKRGPVGELLIAANSPKINAAAVAAE